MNPNAVTKSWNTVLIRVSAFFMLPCAVVFFITRSRIVNIFVNSFAIYIIKNTRMDTEYITDQTFEPTDGEKLHLVKGEYENCRFNNCDFSNCDLSGIRFTDCTFNACNLSLAKLSQTAFRDAVFINCKMLGLQFDTCAPFGLSFRFENCILNHSTFYGTKIKKTRFKDSNLLETDFSQCDLSESIFLSCDLTNAIFDSTLLLKADFRTSVNYRIDPENNRIKKAKFSLDGLPGLLQKYDIEIVR